MSKSVLIVEKDLALMQEFRQELQGRGFEVDETTDGKGAPELIRQRRPSCVVLAVDLDAGQNGYIICKKLKSDADLKAIPIIIIGDPKGFARHQSLKTRAEDYLSKPLTAPDLVDGIARLVGFPELPSVEESFDPASLLVEEVSVVAGTPLDDGADLALVDSIFEEKSAELPVFEDEVTTGLPLAAEKTVVGFVPPAPLPPRSGQADAADARELRSKVTELSGALQDSRSHADELEAKVRQLEGEIEAQNTELEVARASPGKSDNKEVFALRDAANKKDKEILRLKNEVNAKEQEVVELHEKEVSLEQQLSESNADLAKREALIKTLQGKAEQQNAERKKVDQQLLASKEEARSFSAKLQTLQTDFDGLQQRVSDLEGQLADMTTRHLESESLRRTAESNLEAVTSQLDAVNSQLEERTREAEADRSQLEQTEKELDSTRTQLASQAASLAEEISSLRDKVREAETEGTRAAQLAARTESRVKSQQEQLDRLRMTLREAMDTLGEPSAKESDLDIDEVAEA